MRIGMVGLGRMGANMSVRLMNAGHEVVGYDRYPDTARQAQKVGAVNEVRHTPQHTVEGADIVILATPLLAYARSLGGPADATVVGCGFKTHPVHAGPGVRKPASVNPNTQWATQRTPSRVLPFRNATSMLW